MQQESGAGGKLMITISTALEEVGTTLSLRAIEIIQVRNQLKLLYKELSSTGVHNTILYKIQDMIDKL